MVQTAIKPIQAQAYLKIQMKFSSRQQPQVIVALDLSDRQKALNMGRTLRPETGWIKIGLELFTSFGPDIVREFKNMDYKIFLDLKFMDIPNTVYRAVRNCVDLDVDMLSLHLVGGRKMAEAALKAKTDIGPSGPLLIGVTLLTSLERNDLPWNEERDLSEVVLDLGRRAASWGLNGVVCSGMEAGLLSRSLAEDICLVVPGIRSPGSKDDQKRTVTAVQARDAGATHLVVGRPVTCSADPKNALARIKDELSAS